VAYAAEGPPQVSDDDILKMATSDGRLLLTEDHDFGALAFRVRQQAIAIVLIELHGLSTAKKVERVTKAFSADFDTFLGRFTVIEARRLRQRALPPPD
jgi:predicted nuclease of predicted toxin-antitoxin system